MPKVQVTDTLTAEGEAPFVDIKRGSHIQAWNGSFAFHVSIEAISPDMAPIAQWSAENIVLHISNNATTISMSNEERFHKEISGRGRLCFYPRNETIKTLWTSSAEFIAFGPTDSLLRQVAAEVRHGDPGHIRLQGFGIFDDPMLAQMGWMFLELLQAGSMNARLYAESMGVTLAHHLIYKYDSRKPQSTPSIPSILSNRQL